MKIRLCKTLGYAVAALLLLPVSLLSFQSCILDSDEVGDSYYTFTGETVASYLQGDPAHFSKFVEALDTTGIISLLSTYGTYTVFAPVNNAVTEYYRDSIAKDMGFNPETDSVQIAAIDTSLLTMHRFLHGQDGLSESARQSLYDTRFAALKDMVYYQIIDTKAYMKMDFEEGRLPDKNMKSRFVKTSFSELQTTGYIYVNGTSRILLSDIEVHNGVIHAIDCVLVPSNMLLPDHIRSFPQFSLFAEALFLTHLSDSLLKWYDNDYVVPRGKYNFANGTSEPATEHMYGYTALIEPNDLYASYGINNINDLAQKAKEVYDVVYPEDAGITDVTDRRNSLNRFVAYHLFDYQVGTLSEFTAFQRSYYWTDPKVEYVDYLLTMAPHTLIEVRDDGCPALNRRKDGSYIGLNNSVVSNADNGDFYVLEDILFYDKDVVNDVLNKRLRIDVFSTLGEMITNGYRYRNSYTGDNNYWFPSGYFKDLQYNDDATEVNAAKYVNGSVQYQGGMFYIYGKYNTTNYWFDFTYNLPPVPDGTWEFRLGIKKRAGAIVQIYVDGMPNGIPIDMSVKADNPASGIGWMSDTDASFVIGQDDRGQKIYDSVAIAQNDKDMRNHGWMKGPRTLQGNSGNSRGDKNTLRQIMGRYQFDADKQHTLRVKCVGLGTGGIGDGQPYFGLDWVEFIPTGLIESEDQY